MISKGDRMKKKVYDVTLLLTVLLLFSASLGVLHGRKALYPASTIDVGDDIARIILTLDDALDYLDPLIMAANLDAIARIMHQFEDSVFFPTLHALIHGERRHLTPEQKIQLLLALIVHDKEYDPRLSPMPYKQSKQNIFINQLARYFAEYPVLYDATQYYGAAITPIIAWGKRHDMARVVTRWIERSLEAAIDHGDVQNLQALMRYGIYPTKRMASELLHRVVVESQLVDFVAILVGDAKANPNYSPDKKHTILMKAVQAKNVPMIRALVSVGARPDLMLDPAVGSAKQISFQMGTSEIDQIFSGLKSHQR